MVKEYARNVAKEETMTVLIPILVALVGALVYGLSANSKVAQLGYGAYQVGLFWTVAEFAGRVVSLFK